MNMKFSLCIKHTNKFQKFLKDNVNSGMYHGTFCVYQNLLNLLNLIVHQLQASRHSTIIIIYTIYI